MLEGVVALLAGLLIGSFLNVCIYRMPRDLSVVKPRSHCPTCKRLVAWYDNIPVLSYAVLGGRCRYCKTRIPLRYPIVEAITGTLFLLIALTYGPTLVTVKLCVFAALVVGLMFTDMEELILPDEFTLGGTLAGLVFAWFVPLPDGLVAVFAASARPSPWISLGGSAVAAAVAAGALWLVGAVYKLLRKREGLGLGDVKMVAMIGAFLGLSGVLLTLVLGSITGSVLGLAFILATRKDAAKYEIPFGAFLGAAALFVALFGEPLLQWYLSLGG